MRVGRLGVAAQPGARGVPRAPAQRRFGRYGGPGRRPERAEPLAAEGRHPQAPAHAALAGGLRLSARRGSGRFAVRAVVRLLTAGGGRLFGGRVGRRVLAARRAARVRGAARLRGFGPLVRAWRPGALAATRRRVSGGAVAVAVAGARRAPAVAIRFLGVGRWLDVVLAGPCPALLGREAAAGGPALLGGAATARVVLARERYALGPPGDRGQRQTEGRQQVGQQRHRGAQPAPQRSPGDSPPGAQHGEASNRVSIAFTDRESYRGRTGARPGDT